MGGPWFLCVFITVYICKNIFFKIYVPFHYFLGCLLLWPARAVRREGGGGGVPAPTLGNEVRDGYHLRGIGECM